LFNTSFSKRTSYIKQQKIAAKQIGVVIHIAAFTASVKMKKITYIQLGSVHANRKYNNLKASEVRRFRSEKLGGVFQEVQVRKCDD